MLVLHPLTVDGRRLRNLFGMLLRSHGFFEVFLEIPVTFNCVKRWLLARQIFSPI